jgi:hypothetical protein
MELRVKVMQVEVVLKQVEHLLAVAVVALEPDNQVAMPQIMWAVTVVTERRVQ